jgi:hypothetical protein
MTTTRNLVPAATGVLLLVGAATAFALEPVGNDRYEQTSTVASPVERLSVRTGSGDVDVSAGPDADVHVLARVSYRRDRPQLIEELSPAGLLLEPRCADAWFAWCSVDYEIQVPAGFAVDVEIGSGEVRVRAVDGPVDVDASSGDVQVEDVSGELTLHTASGTVSGDEVDSAVVRASTSSGDVRLDLLAPREVVAGTGSGEVEIAVPVGRAYRVETDTGSGSETVDVPVDPDAPGSIRATTGSGDVTVLAR